MLICFQREASAYIIESAEGARTIDCSTLTQVEGGTEMLQVA